MAARPGRRRLGPVRVTIHTRAEHDVWDGFVAAGDVEAARLWAAARGEQRGRPPTPLLATASEGLPASLVPWGGGPPPEAVVWVAALPLHRGLVPYAADGVADVSLCLSAIRRRAKPGDVILLVTAAAPRGPPAYVAASRALAASGARAVVGILRVAARVPLRRYCLAGGRRGDSFRAHALLGPKRRATAMYCAAAPTAPGALLAYDGRYYVRRSRARWHDAADLGAAAELAVRQDLSGPVLLATSWRAWGSGLGGAPRVSPALGAWLHARRAQMRGGIRATGRAPEDVAVFDFVELLGRCPT